MFLGLQIGLMTLLQTTRPSQVAFFQQNHHLLPQAVEQQPLALSTLSLMGTARS